MRPTSAPATLRPDLGSMVEYDLLANRGNFIANTLLPILSVDLPGDTFGKIPLEQLLKRADVRRGPKGNYNRIDWSFTTDSYSTEEYGLEGAVDQRNARKYANYIDAEASTARLVLHQVLLEAEYRVRDLLFPGTYTPTPITNEWDDAENATPIADVEAACRRVFAATGIWPNAIVFNELVFRNLCFVEEIIERIQAAGAGDKVKPADINTAMLAACFRIPNVIVAKAIGNTADEGQTATPGHIWTNEYAAVGVIGSGSQDIIEPCLGHTFHWAGDGSQPGGLIEMYESNEVRSEVVRVRHDVHEKIKYTEMWDVMENITT